MNEIEKFIAKFQTQETVELFSDNCSYWFSIILHRRFIRSGAKVVFSADNYLFGTLINGKVYGIEGDISQKCKWVSWVDFMDLETKDLVTKQKILF